MFVWHEFQGMVDGFSDSNWAGDHEDRKSTSGSVLQVGMRTSKTWNIKQQIIALSSGKAELYAMVTGCAQAKGMCSILQDLGFDSEARTSSDASAALGMVQFLAEPGKWPVAQSTQGRLGLQAVQRTCSPHVVPSHII